MFKLLEGIGEHLDSENIGLMLESFDTELKKEEEKQSNIILEFKEKWTDNCQELCNTIVNKCDLMKVLIGKCLSKKIKEINPHLQRQVQSRIDRSFPDPVYDNTYPESPTPQMPLVNPFARKSDFPNSGSTGVLPPPPEREMSSAPALLEGGGMSATSSIEGLEVPRESIIEISPSLQSSAKPADLKSENSPALNRQNPSTFSLTNKLNSILVLFSRTFTYIKNWFKYFFRFK